MLNIFNQFNAECNYTNTNLIYKTIFFKLTFLGQDSCIQTIQIKIKKLSNVPINIFFNVKVNSDDGLTTINTMYIFSEV
jgi:hypothetical protein